tara:strand:+ start:272 stop:538 length:267 start_codon:yes stop_codon:yes gene_type:complete
MGICQSLKVDHQLTAEEVMILLLGEYFIDPEILEKEVIPQFLLFLEILILGRDLFLLVLALALALGVQVVQAALQNLAFVSTKQLLLI